MRGLPLILLFFFYTGYGQNALPAIGSWREHLPYQSAIDVTVSGKKIYCATPFSLFSIDPETKEVQRISKIAGLSETGVSTISGDPVSGKLYIAYTNGNIDVLDQKGINNIPGFKRANISGNKTVYQFYPDNDRCYLATGIGVLVIDPVKYEISDSWFIGNSGGYVQVNGFVKNNQFFYAATEEGLKTTSTATSLPADFHNWKLLSGSNGLPAGACSEVVAMQNHTIALEHDSLFQEDANGWHLFFANGWPVATVTASDNKLFLCQRTLAGASQVLVLGSDGAIIQTIQQPGVISYPEKGISFQNQYWIADRYGALSQWTGSTFEQYKLNSPEDVASGQLTVFNNTLYAAAGSVNEAWNYQYNRNGVYQFKNGTWTNYNQFHFPVLDTLMDFITVAIDPGDESIWAGSFGGGLLHIKNNELLVFKQNSPLEAPPGDPGSYRVAGLAFDAEGNLWVTNFGANHQLHVLKKNGDWQSFTVPFYLQENAAAQIIIDDINQKWIVSPLGNGLLVFNHGQSIENIGDDQWKIYKNGAGNGNLPSNEVTSIARDKDGYIWVGTDNGVAVIQCPQETFTAPCDAVWPVIQDGSFASYLFSGQRVQYIAVDGANRKWMATTDGAWLISAEGDKVLAHYTEDNSPLLSSDVKSIAVNGKTGEVFFATAKGICSFRGTATEAEETRNDVLVFPNPVPPAYNGTIGIRGLPENSIVKITETNGRLVYQTRADGGQATWNGKDYKGNQAASGIYLVLAVDDRQQEKVVAKIVFISK